MHVFTIQIGKWRLAQQHNVQMINTTVKDGMRMFAPTWDMVMGHKNGRVSDEEYTADYRKLMIQSMKDHRLKWEDFLKDDTPIALACYCKPGVFCHRHLLLGLFKEICEKRKIEFLYYGELE